MENYEYKESPFQPGIPVSPEYFEGRTEIVKKINRNIIKVQKGEARHYFITGKKGIGKTSLVQYVQKINEDKLISIYVPNKGNDSLEVLVSRIFERTLNKLPQKSIKKKVKEVFGNIESLQIKNIGIKFKPSPELQKDLVEDFLKYYKLILKEFKGNNGIFLVLDDINGLSKSKRFLDWYKTTIEEIAMNEDYKLPIYFLLTSYPESFKNMANIDESFVRIFRYDNIEYLDNTDVENFFKDRFENEGIHCNIDALKIMTSFSSGIPLMMQEIGEAVFWATDKDVVTINDAIDGIIQAGALIGQRQIKPVLDKSIRSETYESILLKLGEFGVDRFIKREFETQLTEKEKKSFGKFLTRAVELNILESIGKERSGEYKFTNKLYLVYFMILNLKIENRPL